MPCNCTETYPHLVEEFILNPKALPPSLANWRVYRIEYGFECSCPEGWIYLPPNCDSQLIEDLLNSKTKGN